MQDIITIRERFSSRREAEDARERLESAGFSRNSMNLMRIGERFELAIQTRPENRQRAQECLDEADGMFDVGHYGREFREHAPSPGQSLLLVGVIAAIGAGLYYAFTRQRDVYAQLYPARQRAAVRSLYQAHREEHAHGIAHRSYPDDQRLPSPGLRPDATGYGV